MTVFQLVLIPLCLLFAIRLLVRTWRNELSRRGGTLLVLIWAGAGVLIAIPEIALTVASWVGIGRGSDLVLYLAVLGGVHAMIHLYHRTRQLEVLLTELVRQHAADRARHGPAAGHEAVGRENE